MPPSFDNPSGFYENNRIVNLNNTLLNKLGGSWDKPVFEHLNLDDPKLFGSFLVELTDILNEEFEGQDQIVIAENWVV